MPAIKGDMYILTHCNYSQPASIKLDNENIGGHLTPLHNGTAPSYLAETLQKSADVGGRQRLRSAATSTLVVPQTRRATLGDRAFPVAAARAWNALPLSVRAVSLLLFRRELKTTLFRASYA